MTSFPPCFLPQLHISCFSFPDLCDQANAFAELLPAGKGQDQQLDGRNLMTDLTMGASNLAKSTKTRLRVNSCYSWLSMGCNKLSLASRGVEEELGGIEHLTQSRAGAWRVLVMIENVMHEGT